jgi:hypothetical protein
MKRTAAIVVGILALAAAGCGDRVPTPGYVQGRAIDQDIDATHVKGPMVTSPAFTQKDTAPALTPWRNEETIDRYRAEQTGQLPQ